VDIKFMPKRWIKMLSPIAGQKKRQQRWRLAVRQQVTSG
jgi:hypothetical protein